MTAPGGDLPPHPGLAGGPVYLDCNAITPVDPRVAQAMLPYLMDLFGNPSSSHLLSQEPRRALAEARAQVAALIGAGPFQRPSPNSAAPLRRRRDSPAQGDCDAGLLALRGRLYGR